MANGVSTTQIREFLATLPVNKVFHLSEIMELIEREPGFLSDEDWKAHTNTRPTTYPQWKHRLQNVLEDLKKSGKVKHDPDSHTYTFY